MAKKENTDENKKSAAYNQAIAIVNRLDNFHNAYATGIMYKDFESAYEALNLIFDEIFPKIKDDERGNIYYYKEAVTEPLRRYIMKAQSQRTTLIKGGAGLKYKLLDDLREALDKYSKLLRYFEDKYKFGMPDSEDASQAMIR